MCIPRGKMPTFSVLAAGPESRNWGPFRFSEGTSLIVVHTLIGEAGQGALLKALYYVRKPILGSTVATDQGPHFGVADSRDQKSRYR